MSDLIEQHCKACEGGVAPLSKEQIQSLLAQVPEWQTNEYDDDISRSFKFKNYYETMAFVNAIAWMAHQENHHPDLEVSYQHCRVRYQTHAIGGLSDNDFICAAKIDKILAVT